MDMNSREHRPQDREGARWEGTSLDRNYRRIGISAVAAAVRYCGAKEPDAAAQARSDLRQRDDRA